MGSISEAFEQDKAFPRPPTDHLDWNNLGVGVSRRVDGHVELKWTAQTQQWSEPAFVESPLLTIDGLASALNYGMQAYEGMRVVRGPSGDIRLFRPDKHAARMQHSCECISIPTVPEALFIRCVSLAVALNARFVPPCGAPAALYVRPLALGSGAQLNIIAPTEFTFCVFVQPTAALLGHAAPVDALVLEEFDRAAPRGTGSAKVGGNYAPAMRYQKQAKADGYGITLHLDSQTRSEIDEFSAAGFIGIKRDASGQQKHMLVIPDSPNILRSVTSDTCVEIAESLGWTVQYRSIKYTELKSFDEVLAVGTAATVVPIRSITRRSLDETISYSISTGESDQSCFGVLFRKISDAQYGIDMEEKGWTAVIQAPGTYI